MSSDIDFELNADRLREECGVFGIYGHPDAAALTALGLHALQHRGALSGPTGRACEDQRRQARKCTQLARGTLDFRVPTLIEWSIEVTGRTAVDGMAVP